MNRTQSATLALWGLMCVNVCAEPPAWLEDWYEIELIIFIQPDAAQQEVERSTPLIYTEDLVVEAPRVMENVTRAFPLTELERARLRERSLAVDLSTGIDPWFRAPELDHGSLQAKPNESEISLFGTFPDWLLPPGESYDPLFISTFEVVPFGNWFSYLALASLLEDEDEEELDDLAGEIDSESNLTEESDESIEEPEITREEILAQVEAFREELELTSYIMDEQNVRLPRTAERMRSKGVHIVKHFNWHQYVPSLSTTPEYVFFQSLDDYPTEGYFGVSKGRFIHVDIHLWIHQSTNSLEIRNPVYEIVELRRMQREDVHYFDHPRFGILAEVVKIDLPSDLQVLWDSLD